MLKAHSRPVADATVANAQSQVRNNPAKEAKEEKNLPTDCVSLVCQALYKRIINKRALGPLILALDSILKQ